MSTRVSHQLPLVSHSACETRQLGRALAAHLRPGDVICLLGDLGAGKTTFVQGLAEGLDSPDAATSPSYVLVHEYRGRLPLFHLDLYRVSGDLTEIGVDEVVGGEGVAVIEWSERLPRHLCEDALEAEFSFDDADENTRHIVIRATRPRARRLLESFSGKPYVGSGP